MKSKNKKYKESFIEKFKKVFTNIFFVSKKSEVKELPTKKKNFSKVKTTPAIKPISLTSKWQFIFVWITAVFVSVIFYSYYLNIRFEIIKTEYNLSKAKIENKRLNLYEKELKLELATITSLNRIREEAKQNLDMKEPVDEQIVIIKQSKNRYYLGQR